MNWATPNSSKTLSTEVSEVEVSSQTRQALIWALGAYLPPLEAERAAMLWQPAAAQQASITAGLSRYCRTVAQHFGLRGREAELHLRIIRAMQVLSKGKVLPQEAVPVQTAQAQPDGRLEPPLASSSANDSQPPFLSVITVQRFVEAVELVVSRECPEVYSPTLWRQSLLRHSRKISKEQLTLASDWFWGRTPNLQGDWPARGAGTRLINTAYVTMAEWLGPVRADAQFTAIVREFEHSQDGSLTSIRRYL
jgi:hypothetical protein